MKINVVDGANNHKKLCPMCIVRQEEFYMEKDDFGNLYCKSCGYLLPLHLDAITDSKLEAGNESDTFAAYGKSVSFTQKRTVRKIDDNFNNPLDAWKSGL